MEGKGLVHNAAIKLPGGKIHDDLNTEQKQRLERACMRQGGSR